jgi:hypothetical protein
MWLACGLLKANSHIACHAAKGLECLSHLICTVRPCLIHTCHTLPMPRPCHAVPWPWEEQHGCGIGMAGENQTWPHCVNQMGKTHSKPLTAWHGHGMLCVNRPLLCAMLRLLYCTVWASSHQIVIKCVDVVTEWVCTHSFLLWLRVT